MSTLIWKAALGVALAAGLAVAPLAVVPAEPAVAAPAGAGVVINEAYTNGGSNNAPYKNKFVELYNTTDSPISLEGWSVQYRSATGTSKPSAVAALTGTIQPRSFFLIQGGSNGSTGAALPTPDLIAGALNFAGVKGTVILSTTATALSPLATGSVVNDTRIADLLGYGSTNTYETASSPAPTATTDPKSINRSNFTDTDSNKADFALSATVTPKNSTAPAETGTPTETPLPSDFRTIAEIQGTGTASPLASQTVSTRGKVTAVFPTGGFNGYYIQTAGTGGDMNLSTHSASDGIFVYSVETVGQVQVGDYVQVQGTVSEYYDLTQLTVAAAGLTKLADAAPEVKPANVGLPADALQKETLEGMLLAPQGAFTITNNYNLNKYGEIGLTDGTKPLLQPTVTALPGSAEYTAAVAYNTDHTVTLDDGATTNFLGSTTTKAIPLPYLTTTDPARVGSAVTFTTNVVFDYRNSLWKYQPLTQLTADNAGTVKPASFSATRTSAPAAVGGTVKLATFNVLNYFTTTGDQLTGCTYYKDRDGNPITVSGGCDARGAANAVNLKRQEDKIVSAINASTANVVSLLEIENSAAFGKNRDDALSKLTAALNAAAGDVWSFVPSPTAVPASEDVIRNAFIYRKATVETVGESAILIGDPAFDNAREPLAQAFRPKGGTAAGTFVAIANHFKSKGSAPASGPDADQGDGQGAWNAARTAQAQALVTFANDRKTASGTDKVFLVGDFNAYKMEDPLKVLTDAGYVNVGSLSGKQSYAFGGATGSLDHIFASATANSQVTGQDIWNINSVESVALEYSRYNYNVTNYYNSDQYRASDHDPILVGVSL